MRASNRRLTILSELEQFALYDPPDFDEDQRTEFLTFTETELQLILGRPNPTTQVYCAIQLGYFKAKQLFFRLSWKEIDEEDIFFIAQNYFSNAEPGRAKRWREARGSWRFSAERSEC